MKLARDLVSYSSRHFWISGLLVVSFGVSACQKNHSRGEGAANGRGGDSAAKSAEPRNERRRVALRSNSNKDSTPRKPAELSAELWEEEVLYRPESILKDLSLMGTGQIRRSYIFGVFTRLANRQGGDPESVVRFLELVDQESFPEDSGALGLRPLGIANRLGFAESLGLIGRLSSPEFKSLVASDIGAALAKEHRIPSIEELKGFDELTKKAMFHSLGTNLRFSSVPELATFVETYSGRGVEYQDFLIITLHDTDYLGREVVLDAALRSPNKAASSYLFQSGLRSWIREDLFEASRYLAEVKEQLDPVLYQTGARTLGIHLQKAGDADLAAMWLEEASIDEL
jgi:hypothetical protein